jgi:hypothetical protein
MKFRKITGYFRAWGIYTSPDYDVYGEPRRLNLIVSLGNVRYHIPLWTLK